jgi:peptidoglycan hydrolase CwlO-like protein
MKNYIILLVAGLFFMSSSAVIAQRVIEDDVSMSLGVQNSLFVELDKTDKKLAEKLWKEYIKDYGKTKRNKKAKEYNTLLVRVPAISTSQDIDIYTKFEEMGDMTRAYFWFDMQGSFLNTIDYDKEASGAEMFIKDYALLVKKEVISSELKNQEKTLKNLEKDLSKLEKNNENYHKDIEEARKKIAEREQEIEKNLGEQEAKRIEIQEQQQVVEEIIDRINNIRKS